MTPKARSGESAAGAPPAATGGTAAPPPAPIGWPVRVALALTLAALLAHAWSYSFLTDDAYISFRYARNLAHGHGLVFNPGGERVEGYSNLLWVLILAALDRAGIPPERAANPLSLAATAGLGLVLVRLLVRRRAPGASAWWLVLPPAFLAANRSVAVWSTSGLETRAFELLAIAGIARVADEVERLREGRPVGAPWGGLLLGLAAITRPDGALVAACALAAGVAMVWRARRLAIGAALRLALERGGPALALVAAQYAFRLAYYGVWAPNTYYAKVGGQLRPAAGLEYLTTFALEYAAFLWLPLVAVAYLRLRRSPLATWILVATAALVPHVAYVVAIGGDHFEYRPLDLVFPLVAVLIAEGARLAGGSRSLRTAAAALAALAIAGSFYLPWRSHAEFPRVYMPGFPGLQISEGPIPDEEAADANRFLDPERSWLTRLPLLHAWGTAHRDLLRRITAYYSGIRQEEHRHFFGVIHGEGLAIRDLIARGLLPADVSIATDCVGAVPYLTDARTLDRLGLTDAHVAHQPFSMNLIAHGKQASFAYARERGTDLWFYHPAQLVIPVASSRAMRAFTPLEPGEPAVYVAPLDGGRWLMARFPLGAGHARARMPKLAFWDMSDPADARAARSAAIAAWTARRDSLPRDTETLDALGFLHAAADEWGEAAEHYRRLAEIASNDPDPLVNLAACRVNLGDAAGAEAALREAAGRARAAGDAGRLNSIEAERAKLRAGPTPAAR